MSTTTHDTERPRGRWLVFGICVAAGLAYLAIGLARHEPGFAISGLLIMLGYGVVLLGGALWTLATGSRYEGVFTGLCAVGGLSLVATAWYARRG